MSRLRDQVSSQIWVTSDRWRAGVLNDSFLAMFADQRVRVNEIIQGRYRDLLFEEGFRVEIPRRYQHDAKPFA